jgi:hypothetical protein
MKNKIFLFSFLILVVPFISAVPGIPHQFYGSVIVNGVSAPDNNIITASIEGETYTTVTKDGFYGHSPNIFYIEDPNGNRAGKTIFFYVGGKPAGSAVFENNGYTKLDFSLTTACGDNYCLGDETCSTCASDCGICTTPPVITIISPESKIYNTQKIDLKTSSDQPLIIWMYSLDGENFVTFNPDIILTLGNGKYTLNILGINKVFQIGKSEISFSVDVPYCGNSVCDNGETCSTCASDCGACSSSSSSSSGSSGGGGGGGGGGSAATVKKTNNTKVENLSFAQANTDGETPAQNNAETTIQNENGEKSNWITGAFSTIGNAITKTKSLIFGLAAIIIIFVIIIFVRNKKYKNQLKY